jgi:phosphonoacetaldehyde hydrolase
MAPEPSGRLCGVILDLAGTVVDYGSCAPAGVFIEVFKRRGVEITTAEARAPMGAHKRDHIAAVAAMPDVGARWLAVHGAPVGDADIGALYADLIPLQVARLPDFSGLIPGALEAIAAFRERGLKVATTTGYNREMTDVVLREMRRQAFEPDVAICVDDVPAGRPEPWMALQAAMRLRAYPVSACVKVGDTVPDIAEGLNAGMWSVAVAATGNELGLSQSDAAALPSAELEMRVRAARDRLAGAGAHYVVRGISEVPALLAEIEARLASGDRP